MNKGNEFARGHLGTEIQNKADTVISVEKAQEDPKISVVKSLMVRGADFEPQKFGLEDQDGVLVPVMLGDYLGDETGKSRKPTDLDRKAHHNLLREMYKDRDEYTVSEFKEELQYQAEMFGFTIAERNKKIWLRYYIKQRMVVEGGHANSPKKIITLAERVKDEQPSTPF
jgi:hypothetical protein